MESKSSNKALVGIIVVVLLVVATTGAIVWSANNTTKETETVAVTTSPSPSTSTTNGESNTSSPQYKSGSYSADGDYQTPGGRESVGVSVTLSSDGTITEASVSQEGKTGEAQEFQSKFASGFKSQVIGKKIDEVSLSRVAGSSLTPNGFNNAIDDIQNQAKA